MVQDAAEATSLKTPAALRARARHVRDLARSVLDERTQQELSRFANELDARAAAMEQSSGNSP